MLVGSWVLSVSLCVRERECDLNVCMSRKSYSKFNFKSVNIPIIAIHWRFAAIPLKHTDTHAHTCNIEMGTCRQETTTSTWTYFYGHVYFTRRARARVACFLASGFFSSVSTVKANLCCFFFYFRVCVECVCVVFVSPLKGLGFRMFEECSRTWCWWQLLHDVRRHMNRMGFRCDVNGEEQSSILLLCVCSRSVRLRFCDRQKCSLERRYALDRRSPRDGNGTICGMSTLNNTQLSRIWYDSQSSSKARFCRQNVATHRPDLKSISEIAHKRNTTQRVIAPQFLRSYPRRRSFLAVVSFWKCCLFVFLTSRDAFIATLKMWRASIRVLCFFMKRNYTANCIYYW